jgi:hypothetical protein
MEIKRVRYFPGQLLGVADYVDEQRYLVQRLETALRLLHGTGVIVGLTVTTQSPTVAQPFGSTLAVAPGVAITETGRVIALEQQHRLPLPSVAGVVWIQILDVATDPVSTSDPDFTEFSRWEEQINVNISTMAPPDAVVLAQFDGQRVHPVPRSNTVVASLEAELRRSLEWVVFEINNETLWSRIRSAITNFLHDKWIAGVLVGAQPDNAFYVKVDPSTMTQADIDAGHVVIVIGLAVTRPGEFEVLRLTMQTA